MPERQWYHRCMQRKVEGHQKRDPGQGDSVMILKHDKQQGDKIIYHRLHDKAQKTGVHSMLVIWFHTAHP